jgi:UDP-N-acetylglucosamine diphosphorylase / glucose-1-phosphate thymidylyltransferase / UDP-N-acetylgalactosamine diphosphorylase / glucosamine-1-phosphate N-acetyltransferase / galactosamine-1-phosphate N-acetyltransferase
MNIEQILLFEDENNQLLYPFSILHASWELRCGALRNFEKFKKAFPEATIIYQCISQKLTAFQKKENIENKQLEKKNTLIVSSSFLANYDAIEEMKTAYQKSTKDSESKSLIFRSNAIPYAIYLVKEDIISPGEIDKIFLQKMLKDFRNIFQSVKIESADLINYLWDAIYWNGKSIEQDKNYFLDYCNFKSEIYAGVNCSNYTNVFIGNEVKIEPGVFLNSNEGTIIIDDNTLIMANSVIVGPCYIGKNSVIKIGTKLYEKSSIGEFCKVGGEIENTIFQNYSNKQHDGFLGHSFISEWVNLGAGTNNSDLKNTYSEITVQIEYNKINTGKKFLGLLCGDHTKSAINTMFTTGTVIGICSSIVCEGFSPKFVPSFSFGGQANAAIYDIEKSSQVAAIVMKRRNKVLLNEEIELMSDEFKRSKKFF